MDFSEDTATEAVTESWANTPDDRLREVLGSLTAHLHDFVREVQPTLAEWENAIAFLTEVGHKCDDVRQEFILLSDVLGVSMLVETINAQRQAARATASTVLGPFHMTESPQRELGANIDLVGTGTPCVLSGQVTDPDGKPVPGASLDVWQANDKGFYDVQQPDEQPPGNGRGLFRADGEGKFWFRTVTPTYYPIPTDGPVGRMLQNTKRHPYRPAHVHFLVEADGYVPLTTHVFVADSPYVDSDAVFAVKQSLIRDFAEVDDATKAAHYGVSNPFRHAEFNIVLEPRE